ncbi:hypothetical protein [Gorillibacterium massiliense]|uniref:hypothetical protein n=1 Tax=Gorillibacterium massiliense TaxID=1280390 RepID=UPI000594E63F|nr:hypothetical protein [Gorillibacterium massiliense]
MQENKEKGAKTAPALGFSCTKYNQLPFPKGKFPILLHYLQSIAHSGAAQQLEQAHTCQLRAADVRLFFNR